MENQPTPENYPENTHTLDHCRDLLLHFSDVLTTSPLQMEEYKRQLLNRRTLMNIKADDKD